MPILKTRYEFKKFYRPSGSRYASGRDPDPCKAIEKARQAFVEEFGELPEQESAVFELVGVTPDWDATLIEVKEDR